MNDEIIQLIDAMDGRQKYDAMCKAFFRYREAIAPILKEVVAEFKDCTNDEIISLIDADSISLSDTVSDLPLRIKDAGTEMTSPTDKTIYYDCRFKAKNPRLSNEMICISLHINFEVHNDYNVKYPITKRGTYYVAREISSQLGILTETTDYNSLEKAYSIWVCNENIPEKLQNTVTRYHFVKEDLIGHIDELEENYDLMEVVIIRRGSKTPDYDIFKYLNAVFTSDKDNIQKYIDMDRNPQIREEVDKMSGMGQSIYDRGYDKGVEQGKEQGMAQGIAQGVNQGIRALILNNIEEHISKERSIGNLQKLFGITKEKAEEYYVTYADKI